MSKAASSELPPIHITKEIHEELKKNLDQLKSILKDNPKFANTLVENLLLIGNEIFHTGIDNLLFKEYPNINLMEDGRKLKGNVYELEGLIFGDHELTRKEMIKNPRTQWHEYQDMLRIEVEQDVRDIFFCSEKSEVAIIGEAISHLNISNE